MLVWSAALALVQMLIAVLGAMGQVGLTPLAGNREGLGEVTGWAGRARRAHLNMLESLAIFAIVVLVAHVSRPGGRDDGARRDPVLLGPGRFRARLSRRHPVAADGGLAGVGRRNPAGVQPAVLSASVAKRVAR